MEKEAGNNVVEKKRLRDAIQDQVRQYLERGGSITVLQTGDGGRAGIAHGRTSVGSVGDGADVMAHLD